MKSLAADTGSWCLFQRLFYMLQVGIKGDVLLEMIDNFNHLTSTVLYVRVVRIVFLDRDISANSFDS